VPRSERTRHEGDAVAKSGHPLSAAALSQNPVSSNSMRRYAQNMDLTAMVTPGAQSLATAILTDSWSQARTALSRLWAHRHPSSHPNESELTALERAGTELDLARQQAIVVAGNGPESERANRMEVFWIGYLAGQLAARPELTTAIQSLPELLGGWPGSEPTRASVTTKTVSGTVHGNAVQADDVTGGINFNR